MDAIHSKPPSKRYGETLALDGLDLSVRAGEVYGYLEPNGAGKTTWPTWLASRPYGRR